MNILFTADKHYLNHIYECIESFLRFPVLEGYDIYIFHSDCTEEDIRQFELKIDNRANIHFIFVDPEKFSDFPDNKRYPKLIYYRIYAAQFLPEELDRILYLDGDIVVINPLDELYQTDFEDNYFCASTHVGKMLKKVNQLRLGIKEEVDYINSGVLLMNLQALREYQKPEEALTYALEKSKYLSLPDQDVITALYGNKTKMIDTLKYNLSDRIMTLHNTKAGNQKIDLNWIRENGVIIHYFGKNKPWNKSYIGKLNIFYEELKAEIEGNPFDLEKNEIQESHKTNPIGQMLEYNRQRFIKHELMSNEFLDFMNHNREPFDRLMTYYRCAIMEVETKFKVLNEEYSLQYDRNPIENIKSRVKSPDSLIRKIRTKDIPLSLEAVEENIRDIAGIRVICSFLDDVYMLAEALLKQDDITLIEMKDYIHNPKPSGYRSLHLIVEIPIFLQNEKRNMKVEVQIRTLSMDCWASLEHKLRYKKDLSEKQLEELAFELEECANLSASLDERMQNIRQQLAESHQEETDYVTKNVRGLLTIPKKLGIESGGLHDKGNK